VVEIRCMSHGWCIGWHGWLTVTSKKAKTENVFEPTSSQLQARFRSSHIGFSVPEPEGLDRPHVRHLQLLTSPGLLVACSKA